MSLLTSYGDSNKIVLAGKTQRITCSPPTETLLTVYKDFESPSPVQVEAKQWYEVICHSTASFQYVGMDQATAEDCRDAMISKFRRQKDVWEYKMTAQGSKVRLGWQKADNSAWVQEAEVLMSPMGGHMWQVTVQVDCEDVIYTTTPSSASFDYPSCMSDVS